MPARLMRSSTIASMAVLTGIASAVTIVMASTPSEDPAQSDDGWLLGLLLILGPALAAAATRSVTSSRLLRPVGVVAVLVAAASAAVHAGVAVSDRGATGWVYATPAIVTVILLGAALVAGPGAPLGRAAEPDPAPAQGSGARSAGPPPAVLVDEALVTGPPLEVEAPLRQARAHATRASVAWIAVLVVTGVASLPTLALLGWPAVTSTVEARVVGVDPSDDGVTVTFVARHLDDTVRWSHESETTQWREGDRRVVHIGEDGRVHVDRQFGLAGVPLLFPIAFVGLFTAFALRRLWGLVIAVVDAGRGDDVPRLGYVALMRPPRQWRPLAATWWRDPTTSRRLPAPDAVFRADDETGEEVESSWTHVVVHRAWIDTGRWRWEKPRWIGTERGVVVPHRRALLGRLHVRLLTLRSEVDELVTLHHGPPQRSPTALIDPPSQVIHRLGPMVAWRLLAVPFAIGVAAVLGPGGEAVQRVDAGVGRLVEDPIEAGVDRGGGSPGSLYLTATGLTGAPTAPVNGIGEASRRKA